jgi:photosystem II stability/assembly factor-like uncharacterized protein
MSLRKILNSYIYLFFILNVIFCLHQIVYAGPLDNWHVRYSSSQDYLHGQIVHGNGIFAVGGLSGDQAIILVSPDGVTWNRSSPSTLSEFNVVSLHAFYNGTFVSVGYNVPNQVGTILTSPNGIDWTKRISTNHHIYAATYGSGGLIAVGISQDFSHGIVLISPDGGQNWESIDLNWGMEYWYPESIAYGNGVFIVTCHGGYVHTSPDGRNWTLRDTGTLSALYGITYGNGTFVAVGYDYGYGPPNPPNPPPIVRDQHGTICTSTDGMTWIERDSKTTNHLEAVAYGGGTFVAVGWNGTVTISFNAGQNWTPVTIGSPNWQTGSVSFGNNTFVSVGHDYYGLYGSVIFQSDPIPEIIDSGFNPSQDEFGFYNFFGFYGIPVLEQTINVIGNCAGMTYASLYYYFLRIDPLNKGNNKCMENPSYPPYGNLQRTYIELLELKYNNPTSYGPIDFLAPTDIENLINYNLIKTYIQTFKLPYPIRLKGTSVIDFHAVLVYKIIDDQNSKKMFIYDSNRPYCSGSDEKYIEMEPTANGLGMKTYQYKNLIFSSFRPYLVPFDYSDLPLGWVLHSPGHLRVTDPDGLMIDPGINQISDAIYLSQDIDNDGNDEQLIVIGVSKQGQYKVEVLPNPGDSLDAMYTLTAFSTGIEKILANDVPLKDAPANGYRSFGSTVCRFQVLDKVLNPKRKSWQILGLIDLPKGYPVKAIDTNSITLNGFITPKKVVMHKDDILVHFDATQLLEIAKMTEGKEFKLIINGAFKSGGSFLGEDSVRIISFKK